MHLCFPPFTVPPIFLSGSQKNKVESSEAGMNPDGCGFRLFGTLGRKGGRGGCVSKNLTFKSNKHLIHTKLELLSMVKTCGCVAFGWKEFLVKQAMLQL